MATVPNLQQLMQWGAWIQMAASLGVQSWATIKAAMSDAGLDNATIESLKPKWDVLLADVRRAAG